jgi:integrase
MEQCDFAPNTIEGTVKAAFKNTKAIEEFYEKDISEFTQNEVVDLLQRVGSSSRGYLITICNVLRKYYDWNLKEGYITDVDNKFTQGNTEYIIANVIPIEFIKKKYYNYDMFLEYINKIKDYQNKFIAYGIYFGIDFEDLCTVKFSDIDKDNNTVKLKSGRLAEVDDVFIYIAEKANNQVEYDEDGDGLKYVERPSFYQFKPDAPYILKPLLRSPGEVVKNNVKIIRIRVIRKQSGNDFLTEPNLKKNGLINYISTKFEEDGISLKDAFTKKDGVFYRYEPKLLECMKNFGYENLTTRLLRNEIVKVIDAF